eukprot:6131409-Amphidinium_carterae.1
MSETSSSRVQTLIAVSICLVLISGTSGSLVGVPGSLTSRGISVLELQTSGWDFRLTCRSPRLTMPVCLLLCTGTSGSLVGVPDCYGYYGTYFE